MEYHSHPAQVREATHVRKRLVGATTTAFGALDDFEVSSRGAHCDFGGLLGLKPL